MHFPRAIRFSEAWFWYLIGGLIVYEVVAILLNRNGDTISEIMWRSAEGRPIIPFAFGLLCGHLFWR